MIAVKIFSDSRAALQALNSAMVTSQVVKDTISALNLVGGNVERLEIAWIKAHVGPWGNERAASLQAREEQYDECRAEQGHQKRRGQHFHSSLLGSIGTKVPWAASIRKRR